MKTTSKKILIFVICIFGTGILGYFLGRLFSAPQIVSLTCMYSRLDIDQEQVQLEAFHNKLALKQTSKTGNTKELSKLAQKISELEKKVSLQDEFLKELKVELQGTLISWPDQVPEFFQAAAFQEIVDRTLDECEISANLVGFDCEEPPCLAVLRLVSKDHERNRLSECPIWQQHYGPRITQKHIRIECGDGRTEDVAFVHNFWDSIYAIHGGNLHKRIEQRRKQIESSWQCLSK
jgi:hypothetical protein